MMANPPESIGSQLGERLFELGVFQDMCGQTERFQRIRSGQGVLVTTNFPGQIVKWGVCRPDTPWGEVLYEIGLDKSRSSSHPF